MYLSGCVFLNARSILHMKYLPDTIFQIFDKFLNILCFLFYWWDITELINTSIRTQEIAPSPNTKNKNLEIVDERIQKAKEIIEKKSKNNIVGSKLFSARLNYSDLSIHPISRPQFSTIPESLLSTLPY